MSDILIENLEPGSKLKSVREYAIAYSVNPKTIQRAFDYLDDIKIFHSIVGEGRFLSSEGDVIKQIRIHLIESEVELFISKMKTYKLPLEEIESLVKECYERNS